MRYLYIETVSPGEPPKFMAHVLRENPEAAAVIAHRAANPESGTPHLHKVQDIDEPTYQWLADKIEHGTITTDDAPQQIVTREVQA